MPVETLGQAFSYGWRVIARCAAGKQTLVWTRGQAFPLSRLESRLRCPMCGSREMVLLFSVPSKAATADSGMKKGIISSCCV